ncbi:hypothetical protein BEQ56_02010 [Anaerolineaceae bacterium oral taxon 439]|nr:hypothetical protein BEQ56_02010 [Anaerolineaceae bacterium oral taxon 439]
MRYRSQKKGEWRNLVLVERFSASADVLIQAQGSFRKTILAGLIWNRIPAKRLENTPLLFRLEPFIW